MKESCNSCEKKTDVQEMRSNDKKKEEIWGSVVNILPNKKPKEDKPKFPTVEEVMRDKEYYSNYMIPLRELKCIKYE